MKITILSIPEEGQVIELNPSTAWVREMIAEVFPTETFLSSSVSGSIDLNCVEENVTIRGHVDIDLQPPCDRCLEVFDAPLSIDINLHLSPSTGRLSEKEQINGEVELTPDDLDFTFYKGVEIDLQEIIREQIVLALPLQFLCSEECRGLCPQCGINLNLGSCQCVPVESVDPRWEVLRKLKDS